MDLFEKLDFGMDKTLKKLMVYLEMKFSNTFYKTYLWIFNDCNWKSKGVFNKVVVISILRQNFYKKWVVSRKTISRKTFILQNFRWSAKVLFKASSYLKLRSRLKE